MKRQMMAMVGAAFALTGAAAIRPATLITDNMVLQRERNVPIWGRAMAGNEIKVTFASQSKKTVVGRDGKWRVDLEPMAADAEAQDLVIVESKPGWFGSTVDEKVVTNVVVGEVWLCGGQSNMTFSMWPAPSVGPHAGREMNGYYDLALTHEPSIRGVRMPHCWSDVEKEHAPLAWKPFVPQSNLGGFSAAAWHYAMRLKVALGIPVGVIECGWGGSVIETWIPPFAYAGSKSFKDYATKKIPVGKDKDGKVLDSHQCPRACWNAMVYPLVPYAIRGAIWYQGCSNRGGWRQYYEMLETLRSGWGEAFGCGAKMPFFICQITPFDYNWGKSPDPEANDNGSCRIREEMARWGLDNAPFGGCVNLSDVGELDCIHPGDKRTVGTRLAAMALNRIYGMKDLMCDAPVFRTATLSKNGRKVMLKFDNVRGWCRKGTYVERFELAGADGKYVPAVCHYTANTPAVELDVPTNVVPTKVAYLRKSCVHSFLKNEAGLPLGPFVGDVTVAQATGTPRFAWRGFMVDVSRHFFTVAEIRRMLDLMHAHGLNVFHWHLIDGNGWRAEIRACPELTGRGAVRKASSHRTSTMFADATDGMYGPFYYTQDEMRGIVAYAARLGIRVVPEVEIPGHEDAAIGAIPDLGCPGLPNCGELCVGNDRTIRLFETVLDEIVEIFPDEVVHIGGDECQYKNWAKCPRCQARMKAVGAKDGPQLQAWVAKHFADYLAKKGRRMMGWDQLAEYDALPRSVIIQSYRGSTYGIMAAKKGFDVVMSPDSHCYLDYPQQLKDDPYEYQPFGEFLPIAKIAAFDPLADVPPECRRHILGAEGAIWTEIVTDVRSLEWHVWPRLAALAAVLDEGPAADAKAFEACMGKVRERLVAQGVNAAPLGPLLAARPELPAGARWETFVGDVGGPGARKDFAKLLDVKLDESCLQFDPKNETDRYRRVFATRKAGMPAGSYRIDLQWNRISAEAADDAGFRAALGVLEKIAQRKTGGIRAFPAGVIVGAAAGAEVPNL